MKNKNHSSMQGHLLLWKLRTLVVVAFLLYPVVSIHSGGISRCNYHRKNPSLHVTATLRGGGVFGRSNAGQSPQTATTLKKKICRKRGGKREPLFSSKDIPAGTATVSEETMNLIKNIIGAAALGLPAGVAAFGNHPSALLPALVLLVAMGSLSAFCFQNLGKICQHTASTSYTQAWSRSVSPKTAFLPTIASLFVTASAVLTYSMILADTLPEILNTLLGIRVSRSQALLGVTVVALLPLCLLRSLSALAPFSLVGILGMVYTALSMYYRWLTDAYNPEDGMFFNDIAESLYVFDLIKKW
jgi:hypothetical protein